MRSLSQLLERAEHNAVDVANERLSIDDALHDLTLAIEDLTGRDPSLLDSTVSHLRARFDQLDAASAPYTIPYARLMAAVSERFHLPKWIGLTHHDLGKLLKNQWPVDAEHAFRRALAAWGDAYPAFSDVAKGDLGGTLRLQGKNREAEPLLREALAAAQATSSLHNQLTWMLELGNVLAMTSRYGEALRLADEGRARSRQAGMAYKESGFLSVAANACENLGRYDHSIALSQEALAISARLGNPAAEAVDYQNLGNLYARLGRHDEARASLQQAFALAERSGNAFLTAAMMECLGAELLRSGEADQAVDMLERAVRAAGDSGNLYTFARAIGNLANVRFLGGDRGEARRLHEQALQLSTRLDDPRSLAEDFLNLAALDRAEGDLGAALGRAECALRIAQPLGDPQITRSAEWMMARVLAAAGTAPAETVWGHFERAMHAYEQPREHVASDQDRIGLYEDGEHDVYTEAVVWAVERGMAERAFETAERAKSRLLVDGIAERRTGEISRPARADELLARVRAAGPGVAYASFFMAEDETLLFVVDGADGTLRCRRVPVSRRDWEGWRERWFAVVGRVFGEHQEPPGWSEPEAAATLEALGRWVVPPLRAAVDGTLPPRLVIVPHRLLHAVPFHAAIDPEGGYLARAHAVRVLPALELLRHEASGPMEGPVLLVSNPAGTLPPLDHAESETAAIAGIFRGVRLTGTSATVASFVKAAPAVPMIHLACHGRFDPLRPELSALLLAGDEPLLARDIGALRLSGIRLVVGAACESGLNRPGGVDEALGLPRAWLLAGAANVLSALWTVDDAAAERFMLAFYHALRGGTPLDGAYHAAQQALFDGDHFDRDPRIWAPFVLTGTA